MFTLATNFAMADLLAPVVLLPVISIGHLRFFSYGLYGFLSGWILSYDCLILLYTFYIQFIYKDFYFDRNHLLFMLLQKAKCLTLRGYWAVKSVKHFSG